jgi:ubiquinol-cytochrome c reductase iron-sulfur subunit
MTTHGSELEPTAQGGGEPLPDPGIPPHEPRLTDVDAKQAKRAERQVSTMFGVAALGSIGFVVAYLALPLTGELDRLQASNIALGVTLGLALFLIGIGAIQWAKKLMPDVEMVQERHSLASTPDEQAGAIAAFEAGAEESGIGRRKMIRNSLIGAVALLPLPIVFILGDMGPLSPNPARLRASTIWEPGMRVVNDVTFEPIRPEDIEVGQLVNAMPEAYKEIPEEEHTQALRVRAFASVILVRMEEGEYVVEPGREGWDVDGILCYSKICTHVGCPISLYEQQTHNMLCPCHQSTFALADGGKVVFGPARRPLPQLALEVDAEGYLAAQGDFSEPVGPSYWEREQYIDGESV